MPKITDTVTALKAAQVAHAKAMQPILQRASNALEAIDLRDVRTSYEALPDGEPAKVHLHSALVNINTNISNLKTLIAQNDALLVSEG